MKTTTWNKIGRKDRLHSKFDNYNKNKFKTSVLMSTPQESECIVWGALALTLRVSRLAGVAPLRLTRVGSGWRARVSPIATVYSHVILVVLLAGLLTGLVFDLRVDSNNAVRSRTPTSRFTWISELVLTIPIAVVGVIDGPNRMRNIMEFVVTINNIHKKHGKDRQWQPAERNKTILAALAILALNGVNYFDFSMYIANAMADGKEVTIVYLYFCFYAITMLLHYVQLQFTFVAWSVASALVTINKAFEDVIFMIDLQTKQVSYSRDRTLITSINVSDKTEGSRNCSKYQDTILELASSYGTAFDVMQKINKTFSIVLLLLLGSFFWRLVITPYYFVVYFLSSKIRIVNLVINGMFFALHTSNLVLTVEPGHRCQIQMEQTQFLLSRLYRRVRLDDPLIEALHNFRKQIFLNDINFNVAGSCMLTRPLIFAVFGGITTYIMLILQSQVLEENKW